MLQAGHEVAEKAVENVRHDRARSHGALGVRRITERRLAAEEGRGVIVLRQAWVGSCTWQEILSPKAGIGSPMGDASTSTFASRLTAIYSARKRIPSAFRDRSHKVLVASPQSLG